MTSPGAPRKQQASLEDQSVVLGLNEMYPVSLITENQLLVARNELGHSEVGSGERCHTLQTGILSNPTIPLHTEDIGTEHVIITERSVFRPSKDEMAPHGYDI